MSAVIGVVEAFRLSLALFRGQSLEKGGWIRPLSGVDPGTRVEIAVHIDCDGKHVVGLQKVVVKEQHPDGASTVRQFNGVQRWITPKHIYCLQSAG